MAGKWMASLLLHVGFEKPMKVEERRTQLRGGPSELNRQRRQLPAGERVVGVQDSLSQGRDVVGSHAPDGASVVPRVERPQFEGRCAL